MSEELPEGWALAPFSDLINELRNGISTRPNPEPPGIPILRISAARAGGVSFDGYRYLPDGDPLLASYGLRDKDLLFTRYNGSLELLGVCGMVRGLGNAPLLYPDKLMRVRVKEDLVSPEYTEAYFQAPIARDAIKGLAKSSAGQQGISGGDLKAQFVAVPPLREQRRIVDKVESLFEQVNRAKGRLGRVTAILKRFRQAALDVACAGRLTNPEVEPGDFPPDWRQVAVDDLVEKGGIFDGARDHGSQTAVAQNLRIVDYTTSGVRVIRLENLAHLQFVEEKRTYISEAKYAGLVQNTIRKGDVLFGSFIEEQVRVCIFPGLDTAAIAKADCFCIRVRSDAINPEYLALQLATKRTHDSLVEDVHGATRPRINTKQLRKILVPVCSPSEQQEIVAAVHRLFALADSIERRVNIATARADKLPQAILSKAFAGELVPTEAELARAEGRTYETAEALLARIQKERGDANAGTKPGRKRRAAKENGVG